MDLKPALISYILLHSQNFSEKTLQTFSIEKLVIIKVQLEVSIQRRKNVISKKETVSVH